MATNDYTSPALEALKGKFQPGKGPFDDVKLVATEAMRRSGNWVGNADRCDDYDFSDYDLYGMAMHWWHPLLPTRGFTSGDIAINKAAGKVISWYNNMPARGAYDGPDMDAPKVGDVEMKDEKGNILKTKDGGVLYNSPSGKGTPYVVGGAGRVRYNPKDWHAELEREMVFLWLWRELLKKAKKGGTGSEEYQQAIDLAHAFIASKSVLRSQWVLKIPGFVERGNPADNNGRHTYVLFRYRKSNNPAMPAPLLFLPSRAPVAMLNTYRDGSVWRFKGGPGYGRPGWLVEPKPTSGCEAQAFVMGLGTSLFNFLNMAVSFGGIDLETIVASAITVATDAITYAIKGGKGDFKTNAFKDYDLFGKTAKGFDSYQVWSNQCVVTEEWKATTQFSGGLGAIIDYWIAACDEVLPKLYVPKSNDTKPTVVVPVTTVVTPVKKSPLGLLFAGAAAGAVAGGPVGAAVGTGIGAILHALRK